MNRYIVVPHHGAGRARLVRQGRTVLAWLAPLAIFLCMFALVLIAATTVEALAPFIYAIF